MEPREFKWPLSRIYSWQAFLMEPVYKEIASRIKVPEGTQSLLEIGGGDGRLAITIAGKTSLSRIVTTDISKDISLLAGKRIKAQGLSERITAETQDVHKLTYPDHSFDLVISSFSFHHWRDPVAGLKECARVIKPGGTLMIFDGHTKVTPREFREAIKRIGGSFLLMLGCWFGKIDLMPYELVTSKVTESGLKWLSISTDGPLLLISGIKQSSAIGSMNHKKLTEVNA